MKYIFILMVLLSFALNACADGEQKLDEKQQEFCIKVFEAYYKEKLPENTLASLHDAIDDVSNAIDKEEMGGQETMDYVRMNILQIDSLMHVCVKMVPSGDPKALLKVIEPKLKDIQAHPSSTIFTLYDFHSVMSLLYSKTIEDDLEFYQKLAELSDFSLLKIELAYTLNPEYAKSLYKYALEEAIHIYRKIAELADERELPEVCTHAEEQLKNIAEKVLALLSDE